MQRGLDGVRVFHTLYHRRVVLLAERTRPMWLYSGPSDLDRASPEDLLDDEVWSHLGQVLQLKPREKVKGRPMPFNSSIVSTLVCFLFFSPHVLLCFSYVYFSFLIESHMFRRGLEITSPSRTFPRVRRAWPSRPLRRRRRTPGRKRRPRSPTGSTRRRRRLPGV